MPAGNYDLTIEQGATFAQRITYKVPAGTPVDLTGYTARLQVRRTAASPVALSLTTENGGITLGGAAGTIDLAITATATAAIAADAYVYDLELVSGATVTRLLEGNVVVSREVTR